MPRFQIRLPRNQTQDLRTLPAPAFARLMLAVFFSMGSAIICTDLMDSLQRPLWWTLTRACVIGILTGASLTIAGRSRRALFFALPMVVLVVLATVVTAKSIPADRVLFEPGLEEIRHRLAIEGALSVMGMSLGYAIFLRTISTEVSRHIRTRAELVLAEQVQQSLAPPLSLRAGRFEIYGRSQPSSQMGGDLLDAVEQQDELTVYLADVAGHGIQAGVFMAMVKSSVRTALQRSPPLSSLFGELNRVLGGVKTSPAAYVGFTCVRCYSDSRVEYAIAGSGPILHYQASTGSVTRLSMEQFPLGLFAKAEFQHESVPTQAGDLLALLTDGLPEVADTKDEQLGFAPLEAILASHASQALEAVSEAIFSAARQYGAQSDDETLILLRVL